MEKKLIEASKVVLADTFKFYLRAQNYHWNVEGPNFLQCHELFGKIYEESWASLDQIAEQIRAMGSYAPASIGRFSELSQLQDEREQIDATTMIQRLIFDNQTVLSNISIAYSEADQAANYAFSDLMAERQQAHKKHGWMLSSTLA